MYKEIYQSWLDAKGLDEDGRKELEALTDEKDIEYRFGKELEFGTAGMRGKIGMGINMMNVYTVRRATQGVAEYIKTLGEKAMKRGVAISYDTRKFSYEFAYSAAIVLVSNGINAFIYDDVRPVPMLSFAVRELNTVAGIMITASHNPKEDNGYKLYGEDGAQMSPEATAEVVKFIENIDGCFSDKILYNEALDAKIKVISKKVDKKYYKALQKLCLSPKEVKALGKNLKIVYTPVHGSGYIPVTTILKKIGINPILVPEQLYKDPMFSTVKVPNPEYKETLTLGIKLADFKQADVVFGTDPDCDRLGVGVRNNEGEFVTLSGNQVGALLLNYILERLKATGKLDKKSFVVKSFVTTSLAQMIASDYGVELMEVPVGFKFIGEKIKAYDDTGIKKYVFGFEESCGYLRGTHCRDKDAVVASLLFAEMVCYYTYHNIGVYQKLMEIYDKYGVVLDLAESTVYSGLNAMKEMSAVVEKLRQTNVTEIGGVNVVATRDYSTLVRTLADGKEEKIDCSKANAIYYELEGGGFVCVRPSGTEPKLKVYYSVSAKTQDLAKEKFEQIKQGVAKIL